MTPTFASDCDVIDVDNTENDISDDSRGEDSDTVLMEDSAGTKTEEVVAESTSFRLEKFEWYNFLIKLMDDLCNQELQQIINLFKF